ncbi:MAG: tetratricopeptide repeat protein [Candidatus Latescibacterota bacterium]
MSVVHFLAALSLAFLWACGPKPLVPSSPLDTPAFHYSQGVACLERGDLSGAQAEIARAEALDRGYPGVAVARALLAMEQGDFHRAQQQIETALHRDDDFVDAHIAWGRVLTRRARAERRQGDGWLEEASRAFREALRRDPQSAPAHYYQGMACLQALRFAEGREALARVIALNRGDWVARAMAELERVQAVERAAPGSRTGMEIGLSERITRAELGVLLIEEMRLPELVAKRGLPERAAPFRPPASPDPPVAPEPSDLQGCWARPWVEQVLSLRVAGLETFPDGTFQPDSTLTRASYALVNQGLLVLLTGDPSLATRYVGQESAFADVRSDFYAYNAIALSAERGIMHADRRSGRFRPADPVSGAEALLMIRELQNAFRMEF